MTILAVPAPTLYLGDAEIVSGFDISAATFTSLSGDTGFTLVYVPGLMFAFMGASGNTVTLTFAHAGTSAPADYTTGALTAAHITLFGPIPGVWASQTTGLIAINVTGTITGAGVGAYLAPTQTGPKHNPMQMAGANQNDY